MMHIRPFELADEPAVIALWEACKLTRPWNDPHKDIARKLAVQPELFLVGAIDETVIASVMAGYEGHRGWVNYLAVTPRFRGRSRSTATSATCRTRRSASASA
jgi:ribosomal protein S18 acetylase RimI-like enzyme